MEAAAALEAVLVEFLDEETIFGSEEELSSEQIPRYHEWEEFAKVGVNLLERLESFLEPLNMGIDNEDEEGEEEEGEEEDEEEVIYDINGDKDSNSKDG